MLVVTLVALNKYYSILRRVQGLFFSQNCIFWILFNEERDDGNV